MEERPLNDFFSSVTLSNLNGEEVDLNDHVSLVYDGSDGFGMAPFHRLRERSPQQDGELDLGFRLDPRRLRLRLRLRPLALDATERQGSPLDLYTARNRLLHFFKPSIHPLYFTVTLPSGANRRLDVFLKGGLAMPTRDRQGQDRPGLTQPLEVELEAPDPVWYDPDQHYEIFTPAQFNTSRFISYPGNWPAFPDIQILGPITNPEIISLGVVKKIKLECTIAQGEVAHFYLAQGCKALTKDNGATNLVQYLTADSDVENFLIGVSPDINPANNGFRVAGSATSATTSVTVLWSDRYIGL